MEVVVNVFLKKVPEMVNYAVNMFNLQYSPSASEIVRKIALQIAWSKKNQTELSKVKSVFNT